MRFDLASARVAVKARARTTSVRRRVMCDPPHREGFMDGIGITSYAQ
jgi:hypothetical protein